MYCPPLQPTLQPLSSRCTASDRFSYSLSLFRNENFYARKKGKERNSFRRKKRGGIVKDDESSFDPFEGEASLPWLKYRLIKPTLHFHPREFLSFAKTSIELTINNDIASTNKSSLQTSRSNPRFYANFQISAIWFITIPQRILFKTRLKSGPRLSLSLFPPCINLRRIAARVRTFSSCK